jgi:hypothetical protein
LATQIELRRQDGLAVHRNRHQPENVLLQRGDLFGGDRDANREIKRLAFLRGVIVQRLHHLLFGGVAVQEPVPGQIVDLIEDHAPLDIGVAQALLQIRRLVVELVQKIFGAVEL